MENSKGSNLVLGMAIVGIAVAYFMGKKSANCNCERHITEAEGMAYDLEKQRNDVEQGKSDSEINRNSENANDMLGFVDMTDTPWDFVPPFMGYPMVPTGYEGREVLRYRGFPLQNSGVIAYNVN